MKWLVIGIGNTLRRDDGIGPWLAERIAGWNIEGMTVRSVHQLTPELADEIARHECVMFLDAAVDPQSSGLRTLEPAAARHGLGHALGPSELLELASRFAPRRPAWIAAAAAQDVGFGESLSPEAAAACEAMLRIIEGLLRGAAPCMKSA